MRPTAIRRTRARYPAAVSSGSFTIPGYARSPRGSPRRNTSTFANAAASSSRSAARAACADASAAASSARADASSAPVPPARSADDTCCAAASRSASAPAQTRAASRSPGSDRKYPSFTNGTTYRFHCVCSVFHARLNKPPISGTSCAVSPKVEIPAETTPIMNTTRISACVNGRTKRTSRHTGFTSSTAANSSTYGSTGICVAVGHMLSRSLAYTVSPAKNAENRSPRRKARGVRECSSFDRMRNLRRLEQQRGSCGQDGEADRHLAIGSRGTDDTGDVFHHISPKRWRK